MTRGENNVDAEKDFQTVVVRELGEGKDSQKVPRRVIHFASGETMEEYSTEEEEEPEKKDLLSPDPSNLTWGPYVWFHMWRAATSTVTACDYLGEKMATALGIAVPKYQYAIDEYYREKKEEEEEQQENCMSEEAEQQAGAEQKGQEGALTEQPDSSISIINITCELEKEPCQISDATPFPLLQDDVRVSAPVTS
ncbi:protein FAM177A1-like isoform X2 [Conger conger]|uniref:protein FAM177A1-like isoform X2 n=1 Tax=Conger conger TaxID=82655 RepID=UPI002A5A0602|nr:protein FAM177A1-like isoform X2 [Conger conger]